MEKQAEYQVADTFDPAKSQNIVRPLDERANGWQVNIMAVFFDYIILNLTPSEYIVLTYMIRKIQAWGKSSDKISHNLIVMETMIGSKQTVNTAIKGLVKKDMIVKNREAPRSIMTYSLNRNFELDIGDK